MIGFRSWGSSCAVVGSQCAGPGGQAATWSGSEGVLDLPEEQPVPTARKAASGDRPASDAARPDEGLTRAERIRVQQGLAALGFDAGPADGMFGPRTRSAIWDWQQAKGLEATGYLTRAEAGALAASAEDVREGQASREASEGTRTRNEVLYFAAAGPKCSTDTPEGSACWFPVSNIPNCYLWHPYFTTNNIESEFNWSGPCSGDTIHSRGTLRTYVPNEYSHEGTGEFVHGKQQGMWVYRLQSGHVHEGQLVDSEMHGKWVHRHPDGKVEERHYVHGKRQ